jgi:hypothetical protein
MVSSACFSGCFAGFSRYVFRSILKIEQEKVITDITREAAIKVLTVLREEQSPSDSLQETVCVLFKILVAEILLTG